MFLEYVCYIAPICFILAFLKECICSRIDKNISRVIPSSTNVVFTYNNIPYTICNRVLHARPVKIPLSIRALFYYELTKQHEANLLKEHLPYYNGWLKAYNRATRLFHEHAIHNLGRVLINNSPHGGRMRYKETYGAYNLTPAFADVMVYIYCISVRKDFGLFTI